MGHACRHRWTVVERRIPLRPGQWLPFSNALRWNNVSLIQALTSALSPNFPLSGSVSLEPHPNPSTSGVDLDPHLSLSHHKTSFHENDSRFACTYSQTADANPLPPLVCENTRSPGTLRGPPSGRRRHLPRTPGRLLGNPANRWKLPATFPRRSRTPPRRPCCCCGCPRRRCRHCHTPASETGRNAIVASHERFVSFR